VVNVSNDGDITQFFDRGLVYHNDASLGGRIFEAQIIPACGLRRNAEDEKTMDAGKLTGKSRHFRDKYRH